MNPRQQTGLERAAEIERAAQVQSRTQSPLAFWLAGATA